MAAISFILHAAAIGIVLMVLVAAAATALSAARRWLARKMQ